MERLCHKALPQHSPGGTEKNYIFTSFRIASGPRNKLRSSRIKIKALTNQRQLTYG